MEAQLSRLNKLTSLTMMAGPRLWRTIEDYTATDEIGDSVSFHANLINILLLLAHGLIQNNKKTWVNILVQNIGHM